MKFLADAQSCRNEFGLQVVYRLAPGWKDAARRFPNERGEKIFQGEIDLANSFLRELQQRVSLGFGQYGLHHINIEPGRMGLDLIAEQNSYIGHNLTRPHHFAAVSVIFQRYLLDLEMLSKTS